MGRSPCCSKEGLNRGAWTAAEDRILVSYIKTHGEGKWRSLPIRAGLKRCGKSCRLRWLNYLRPDIKRGNISDEEEKLIVRLHRLLGNRWSLIAGRLPGRTDNEIKNYWNTTLGKKAQQTAAGVPVKSSKGMKPAGPPSSSSPVIRTKASKCTKTAFGLYPAHDPPARGPDDRECRFAADAGLPQDQIFARLDPEGANIGKDEGDPLLFDDALLESWLGVDCGGHGQLDMGPDLQSLVSILDSDEWIHGHGDGGL